MAEAVMRAVGLGKRYGSQDALRDLDLEVVRGEVLGYLGPNGAGKTTTIRLFLGLIRPTSGRAELFGLDSVRQAVEAHRRLAYVPGEASLWPSLTGAETPHLLEQVHGEADRAYRDELIGRFTLDPSKKVRAYSKGNRQKVNLIAAFATRADLLVIDEPTSGLDPLMEQAFRHCVREAKDRGQTVFLSSDFLVEVTGSATEANRWLPDTSILHHVTPAPAVDPNWVSAAVLVALGLVAALAGAAVFNRRDLVGA